MRFPKPLDDQMWAIAELDSPDQTAAFFDEYPELREEVVKRLEMVRAIKGAKPKSLFAEPEPEAVEEPLPPPSFTPSPMPVRSQPIPRWLWVGSFAALLASTVFAGWAALRYVGRPLPAAPPTVGMAPGNPAQSVPAEPPASAVQPPPTTPQPSSESETPAALTQPVTIRFDQIELKDALRTIGASVNVELLIQEPFPNQEVRIDYVETPLWDLLNDLGAKFGFTPLIQDARTALIIPARDASAPVPPELPGGHASSVGNESDSTDVEQDGPSLEGPIESR